VLLEGESPEETDSSIVNPARLSPDLQQDVCLQCHLLGDVTVKQPGTGPFDFRPGKRLRDYRSDFFTTEKTGDRPGSVGHASRSMNSKCFTASGGRMTCAKCHLPHEPLKETPAGYYNARCLDCHDDRGCNRALEAGQSAKGGDCVACHMPRVESANIAHAATTEHWIRRRHNSVAAPAGGTAENATARRRPIGFWGDEGDGQLGSAFVLGPNFLGDRAMLEEGINLLQQQLRRDPSTDLLYRLGVGYSHLERWDAAVNTFEEVLRRDANHSETRPLLASTLDHAGRKTEAVAAFEDMLRRNPDYAGSDLDLALLYFQLDRPDRLLQTAKYPLLDHPPDPLVLSMIARAHLLLNDDLDKALALVKQAESVNPFMAAPFVVEAQIALKLKDDERAERALRSAIRAEHSFRPAHIALGELLTRTGRSDEAVECYERVLALDPGNQAAQRALRQLRSPNTTTPAPGSFLKSP
jgi:Tfp pilus assembly protein PilF